MRFLGIDYGTKKVGLAISDEMGDFAYPYKVLPNDKFLLNKIALICDQENIKGVVIGKSLDFKGEPNPIMKDIEKFSEEASLVLGLPINFENETLTSAEATRTIGRNLETDARAAALILKSYLDRKKRENR